MKLINGVVYASEYCFRTESASPTRRTLPVFAQHGAIANGRDARRTVAHFLLEDDHLGPDQAEDGIGLTVPDYVTPGAVWDCFIGGTDDPAQVDCTITAVDGDGETIVRFEAVDDDKLGAEVDVPEPGLYRITAKADYGPVVTQLIFSGPDSREPLGD
ncbi:MULTISPECIES: hypothetical protein [unclassified Streptomyces]|uniref:hypothetical protein n=1 Tax=unclassified Streptomyces TaxID=2593676 RepID=UPI003D704846